MKKDDIIDEAMRLYVDHETQESEPLVTSEYQSLRQALRQLTVRARNISVGSGGLSSTGNRMFWSSALFTRLTVLSQSALANAPEPRSKGVWDFSSFASLVRNQVECYFVLYFLCYDDVPDDQRHCRFLMMHLHDNFTRHRTLCELGLHEGEEDAFSENYKDLKSRIEKTAYFKTLPSSRQKLILKGDRLPFIQDDVVERIGLERDRFRGLYRFLSAHTHTGPLSFYRMSDSNRGTGVETRTEKVYMNFALVLAITILESAVAEMSKLFPNAEGRGAKVSDRNINRYFENIKKEQLAGKFIDP